MNSPVMLSAIYCVPSNKAARVAIRSPLDVARIGSYRAVVKQRIYAVLRERDGCGQDLPQWVISPKLGHLPLEQCEFTSGDLAGMAHFNDALAGAELHGSNSRNQWVAERDSWRAEIRRPGVYLAQPDGRPFLRSSSSKSEIACCALATAAFC
jgi:hypothetical protein